jgi:hypothetical protein
MPFLASETLDFRDGHSKQLTLESDLDFFAHNFHAERGDGKGH